MTELKIEHVERLANLVKDTGLTSLEWQGLKLTRDASADVMAQAAKEGAKLAKSATDDEILFNPLAGLEGMTNV